MGLSTEDIIMMEHDFKGKVRNKVWNTGKKVVKKVGSSKVTKKIVGSKVLKKVAPNLATALNRPKAMPGNESRASIGRSIGNQLRAKSQAQQSETMGRAVTPFAPAPTAMLITPPANQIPINNSNFEDMRNMMQDPLQDGEAGAADTRDFSVVIGTPTAEEAKKKKQRNLIIIGASVVVVIVIVIVAMKYGKK